jgi:hypothetical protein
MLRMREGVRMRYGTNTRAARFHARRRPMKITIAAAIAALTLLAVPAAAQTAPQPSYGQGVPVPPQGYQGLGGVTANPDAPRPRPQPNPTGQPPLPSIFSPTLLQPGSGH